MSQRHHKNGLVSTVMFAFLAFLGCGNSPQQPEQQRVTATATKSAADHPVVILGAGVGGMTSALYLTMAGYKPLVVQGPTLGGLITQSNSVRNWPGENDISGVDLADKLRAQLASHQIAIEESTAIELNCQTFPYEITLKNNANGSTRTITAASIILAMGTTSNYLGVPGEQQYWGGKGVTNCAICEGSLYANKVVGVVGGGDAAVTEALYLAKIAREVHVFVRKDTLRARDKRKDIMLTLPNVTMHFNTAVTKIVGDEQKVTQLELIDTATNATRIMPLDGLFLAIGSTPNSEICKGQVQLDPLGYIVRTDDQATSVPGVFAIGDIADPRYKQAITGAGDGCKAALQAIQHLENAGYAAFVSGASEQEKVTEKLEPGPQRAAPSAPERGVIAITSPEQFTELLLQKRPVIVDFYATWCPPCRRMAPVFEAYAEAHAAEVTFVKVNIDEHPELAYQFGVRSVPTFVGITADGQEYKRLTGVLTESQLRSLHE